MIFKMYRSQGDQLFWWKSSRGRRSSALNLISSIPGIVNEIDSPFHLWWPFDVNFKWKPCRQRPSLFPQKTQSLCWVFQTHSLSYLRLCSCSATALFTKPLEIILKWEKNSKSPKNTKFCFGWHWCILKPKLQNHWYKGSRKGWGGGFRHS